MGFVLHNNAASFIEIISCPGRDFKILEEQKGLLCLL